MEHPDGIELTLALAPRIAPLLAQRTRGLGQRTPADLTFGNLWLFRREHQWHWHDGSWPHVAGVTYDGQRSALPLFDLKTAPADVVRALVARHGALFPLCEHELGAVRDTGLGLADNRDDADYVYQAQAFRTYQGRALQKKANLMTQLLAAHVVDAEPYDLHLHEAARDVLDGWMEDKGKASGAADEAACQDALALAPSLGLRGYLYRADGQPAGFLLAERLHEGVWAIRFAKGLVRFKGIAQYMFHHFASSGGNDAADRIDWLNFEQDLGLSNFRQTKKSYRPAFLLPKWRLLPPSA